MSIGIHVASSPAQLAARLNLGTGHGLENVNEHELHNLTHYTRSHAICRSGKLNIAAITTEWQEYTFIHTENVKLFWCD